MEHLLGPSAPQRFGRGQLEYRAISRRTAESGGAIKSAVFTHNQAAGARPVGAAGKGIQNPEDPLPVGSERRIQLKNGAGPRIAPVRGGSVQGSVRAGGQTDRARGPAIPGWEAPEDFVFRVVSELDVPADGRTAVSFCRTHNSPGPTGTGA